MNISIQTLRNIGPKSCEWLNDVGIHSVEHLERMGPVVAFQLVQQQRRSKVSLNLLWAMVAGLKGIDWRELTHLEKDQLRSALDK